MALLDPIEQPDRRLDRSLGVVVVAGGGEDQRPKSAGVLAMQVLQRPVLPLLLRGELVFPTSYGSIGAGIQHEFNLTRDDLMRAGISLLAW